MSLHHRQTCASSTNVSGCYMVGFCYPSPKYATNLTAMWLCNPITYPPNCLLPWHVSLACGGLWSISRWETLNSLHAKELLDPIICSYISADWRGKHVQVCCALSTAREPSAVIWTVSYGVDMYSERYSNFIEGCSNLLWYGNQMCFWAMRHYSRIL